MPYPANAMSDSYYDKQRPDPDALLHRINDEESRQGKGKLKIFFGMCAGVGKTYEMLKTAQQLRTQGVDVVVGLVETHRRAETEALIGGLEIIPRKRISYKSTVLEEMDLDAVLERKPRIVLVDELAHTNAPGSRHLKRYQDVLELLDNGIDVYTTLNVQHLESRADTVAKITGITVRETVPDSVFEVADEVEVVDTSEEVILQRFAEGKIYAPDRSREALRNFFRKGNISALREMALRLTAERVDQDLREGVDLRGGTYRSGQRFIVGLKGDTNGEEMIRSAKRLAYASKASWIVVHVELPDEDDAATRERLSEQFKLAKELGAEMMTTSDADIARGLLRVAERQNAGRIIVGRSVGSRWFRGHRVVDRLLELTPDIDVHVLVDRRKGQRRRWWMPVATIHSRPTAYVVALALVGAVAGLSYPFADRFGYQTVALLLLMMISLQSLVLGIGPVLLAAAVSAFVWDYFFIPPKFTIAIAKTEDVLMFVAYFVFAAVTGILTSRIRAQERAVRLREERSSALYALTRELSSARSQDDILRVAVVHLRRIFRCEVVVLTGEPDGDINPTPHPHSTFTIDEKELAVAAWTYWNEKSAGRSTDTLPNASATYFPIKGSRYPLAVFGLRMPDTAMHPDQETLLENCLALISTALDREVLNELTRRTSIAEESERLYQALFNSISHEMKTPIAGILGNAENLLSPRIASSSESYRQMVGEIQTSAERLHRLLDNLLDMSRIESTDIQLHPDWVDLHDIVASALRALGQETSEWNIHVDAPESLPLVRIDGALIEQALVNLVHNAATYTPPGSTISIRVDVGSGRMTLVVADNGPGFPPEAVAHAFDKFYRVPGSRSGGTGLGLSIVRGFVEAHKGTVVLENRLSGGAEFTISIPAETRSMDGKDLRE